MPFWAIEHVELTAEPINVKKVHTKGSSHFSSIIPVHKYSHTWKEAPKDQLRVVSERGVKMVDKCCFIKITVCLSAAQSVLVSLF